MSWCLAGVSFSQGMTAQLWLCMLLLTNLLFYVDNYSTVLSMTFVVFLIDLQFTESHLKEVEKLPGRVILLLCDGSQGQR